MRYLKILLIIISVSISYTVQSQNNYYTKAWKQTQSFQNKGLSAQALIMSDSIFQQAKKDQNSMQIVKSLIYKSNIRGSYEEEALLKTLDEIQQEIGQAQGIEKAILLTALSDVYLQYYRHNQWDIRARKEVVGGKPSGLSEWSQNDFQRQIEALLQKALSYQTELQTEASILWKEVFIAEEESFKYQPFLYDFVAWKAIDFYSSMEFSNLAQEDLVLLNARALYQSFLSFEHYKIAEKNLTNKEKTLKIYQQLIRLHQGRKNPMPLVYEEVQRLEFMQIQGRLEGKESILLNTYQELFEQYKTQEVGAIIARKLVEIYRSHSDSETDLQKADAICETMINNQIEVKDFRLIQEQIHQKRIRLDVQGTVIPHQAFTAQLSYKNIQKVWFRVVRMDNDFDYTRNRKGKTDFQKYLSLDVVKDFSLNVAFQEKLREKTALFEMPALDMGHYCLIAASSPDFSIAEDRLSMASFWVSNLQLIEQGNEAFIILNRENGKPVQDADIQVFSYSWEYASRSNVKKKEEELTSDKDGFFRVTAISRSSVVLQISKAADEWISPSIYIRKDNVQANSREKHYFFTDRAIYRPGQRVFFKGILSQQTANKVKVLAHTETEVKIYTTQGKVLQKLKLTSNEYGSIAGSFICPVSGLNGNMRIADKYGQVSIRVEEYKRPLFEISMETPQGEYNLNEEIHIPAKAAYFAGVGVQNAQVKYRVQRTIDRPWRWSCWPAFSAEVDIAAGELQTDSVGHFEIVFQAVAPMDTENIRWYHYEVIAEVTDDNGETHTQNLSLRLGNRSLFIQTDLPEVMDVAKARNIIVKAKTPNGKSLEKDLLFRLEKLKSPNHIIQENFERIDTILISKEGLEKRFPGLSDKNEFSDYEVDAIVLEKKINTRTDSIIPKSIFQSLSAAVYKMTLTTKDKNNREVTETAFVQIFSSKEKKLPRLCDAFFYADAEKLEVGEQLHISFGSSFKNVPYYFQIKAGEKLIVSEWRKLSKEMKHLTIPIEEDYRGGLRLEIFFQRNNHFYSLNKAISVPYSNKKLDIQLQSMRNPMKPGVQEGWSLLIKNHEGDAVAAEVLAGMYDASLDVFEAHQWSLWPYRQKYMGSVSRDIQVQAYSSENYEFIHIPYQMLYTPMSFVWEDNNRRISPMFAKSMGVEGSAEIVEYAIVNDVENDVEEEEFVLSGAKQEQEKQEEQIISPRKNLKETAFFYPQLKTDKQGQVQLTFTSPEALSRWKLMVLANTKDMELAAFSQEFVTQKEIMVMPNIPRFLRGGDRIAISTKILNLLEKEQNITATLEVLDATNNQAIQILSQGESKEQMLSISAQGQAQLQWMLDIPEKLGAVVIRITAQGQGHSDGEEHLVPVLSQLQFLTDTYPFTIHKETEVRPETLGLHSQDYQDDDEVTLEIVTHPLWYVVQALPNYLQPQHPSALSWFNYYFVNAMASSIVKENPQIEVVFKQWQQDSPEELQSNLLQSPELKQILLEETPWVRNAEDQSMRKQEIARLFDKNMLSYQLETAINKLSEMQRSNGGWAWYKGMRSSPQISAEIVSGMGQLKNEKILDFKKYSTAKNITKKAIEYLDKELLYIYQKDLKDDKKQYSRYMVNRIIQARAYFINEFHLSTEVQKAYHHYVALWGEKWTKKPLKEQMNLARVLWLSGEQEKAQAILLSLKDKSLKDSQGGIYWRDLMKYSAAENQALMIELFELAQEKPELIDAMKLWLLQQKRSNDWGNETATVKACYAMLSGSSALSQSPEVMLTIDGETQNITGHAGTGFYQITWRGKDIGKKLQGLKIQKIGDAIAFGAFYYQHFVKIKDIESHSGGVYMEKKVFISRNNDGKPTYQLLSNMNSIPLGSSVLIRLLIRNQQAMDFVHLRDYLPSGFENKQLLSGYRWQGKNSFYQSPGDVATDYYINHLPKGEFVIEYELNATSTGLLNMGPAEIQSLYAPEFGGHSDGRMIIVK